ncbi:hypothetical protein M9H77_33176 [Catharanthus roseus]|uniref:Uncharacterized protein n=1 Tax=Catharanthus roseus TaxID=4058 RepID=A0ACB9ZK33_CATRO|nr:hypothetical protein M9H77_33176 [Catharanthus roseus]
MEPEEKVGGERGNKKEELLGIKLKRGILVGKRGGQSTPSPTWKLGLANETDPFQDFTFPSNFTRTISARKLAANLWEVESPSVKLVKMSKGGPLQHNHKHKNKGFELPKPIGQPPDNSNDQPPTASNLRKHVAEPSMLCQSVERKCDTFQAISSRSCSSVEMMAPYRPAFTPSRFKGRFRESGYNLKTSSELLKVLNRIWSLEEQNISNISLVKAVQKELDIARAQIKALLKEKKRSRQEMDDLMKQLAEANDARRNKEQDRIQETIQSLRNELEDERKLRKHSESLHNKLARKLSEVKSSFSTALKELEREKKARILLEDLCDEFAKGIIDCEQEIRFLNHKSEDFGVRKHTDRLILHISEAWLDERMQMKSAEANSGQDQKTILDKLSLEIETFLQAKQSGSFQDNGVALSKKPIRSVLQRSSLESFHLNEAGSAPKNGNDGEDSLDSGLYSSKVNRDPSQQHRDGSTSQRGEVAANRNLQKVVHSNRMKKRILSRVVRKDSDVSNLQAQFKENMRRDFSSNRSKGERVDGKQSQTIIRDQSKLDALENMLTDEVVPEHSSGKKNKEMESQSELLNKLKSGHSFSTDGMEHQHKNKNAIHSFTKSSFVDPACQVERWTSKAVTNDPEALESSLRQPQGTEDNTLKAKLLEARLESQQSRSRASCGL